jgi:hypothetical protein
LGGYAEAYVTDFLRVACAALKAEDIEADGEEVDVEGDGDG